MTESEAALAYVGREEEQHDVCDPERWQRLEALLDRNWTTGDSIPPLAHYVLFRPWQLQSRIGLDGHPRRDGYGILPDVDLPRRMWAGSRIQFRTPLKTGAPVTRRSRLVSAKPRRGRTGDMLFCTVEHEIRIDGETEIAIFEEQDIVYRKAHDGNDLAPRPIVDAPQAIENTRMRSIDPVMLMRYSALTFNAHRIHYDRDYARHVEGYAGLVVHGPLLATLLFDHVQSVFPDQQVESFSFAAKSPVLDGDPIMLGSRLNEGSVDLSIVGPQGLAVAGSVKLIS